MAAAGELLEHAGYVNHSYGTPRAYVEQQLEKGFHVILDIEIQGARQVREKMPEAVSIFIVPPSMTELRRRLETRGTDTKEVIDARSRPLPCHPHRRTVPLRPPHSPPPGGIAPSVLRSIQDM